MNTNTSDVDRTLTRECVSTTSDALIRDILFEVFDILPSVPRISLGKLEPDLPDQ